jgi:hypothetical protein
MTITADESLDLDSPLTDVFIDVEKVTLELTCSGFGLDAPINDAFITQPGLIKVKF